MKQTSNYKPQSTQQNLIHSSYKSKQSQQKSNHKHSQSSPHKHQIIKLNIDYLYHPKNYCHKKQDVSKILGKLRCNSQYGLHTFYLIKWKNKYIEDSTWQHTCLNKNIIKQVISFNRAICNQPLPYIDQQYKDICPKYEKIRNNFIKSFIKYKQTQKQKNLRQKRLSNQIKSGNTGIMFNQRKFNIQKDNYSEVQTYLSENSRDINFESCSEQNLNQRILVNKKQKVLRPKQINSEFYSSGNNLVMDLKSEVQSSKIRNKVQGTINSINQQEIKNQQKQKIIKYEKSITEQLQPGEIKIEDFEMFNNIRVDIKKDFNDGQQSDIVLDSMMNDIKDGKYRQKRLNRRRVNNKKSRVQLDKQLKAYIQKGKTKNNKFPNK